MTPDRFSFDSTGVVETFDEMLDVSVPQLGLARTVVSDLVDQYLHPNTDVVDLGAATGTGLADQIYREPDLADGVRYVLIETAASMRNVLADRYAREITDGRVEIWDHDLRRPLTLDRPSVVVSFLTLQFVPVEHRPRLLAELRRDLAPEHGALLLVEKIVGRTARTDLSLQRLHALAKRRRGLDAETISRNLLALEGVLVPLTANMNEDLLAGAGFSDIETVWRWGNFTAWLALP